MIGEVSNSFWAWKTSSSWKFFFFRKKNYPFAVFHFTCSLTANCSSFLVSICFLEDFLDLVLFVDFQIKFFFSQNFCFFLHSLTLIFLRVQFQPMQPCLRKRSQNEINKNSKFVTANASSWSTIVISSSFCTMFAISLSVKYLSLTPTEKI